MILKWLTVVDEQDKRYTEWNYLDNVKRAKTTRGVVTYKKKDGETDGTMFEHMAIAIEMDNGEKEIVVSRHSAYLISSETGKTLERLM